MPTKLNQRCRLLELPGELRNQIYRYALVRGSERGSGVVVTTKGFEASGLLGACKTIRGECFEIFYLENAFEIDWYDGRFEAMDRLRDMIDQAGLNPNHATTWWKNPKDLRRW